PTTGDESRLLNTGIGAGVGIASRYAGDALSQWAANRVTQPFMGWTPQSATTTLARGIGSNAKDLGNGALGERSAQLGQIFQAGRNAATSVDLSATPATLDQVIGGLNPSVRSVVESNPNVMDLMSHATGAGSANGQLLGNI